MDIIFEIMQSPRTAPICIQKSYVQLKPNFLQPLVKNLHSVQFVIQVHLAPKNYRFMILHNLEYLGSNDILFKK